MTKKLKNNNCGFTLLELIIVIIILGVLASLALPRLFSSVDLSRAHEPLKAFEHVKAGMEQCFAKNDRDFTPCTSFTNDLYMDDPGTLPGAAWTYALSNQSATDYTVVATYTAGAPADIITLDYDGTGASITGGGIFVGVN